ncbi:ornithine cyclodeaminase family protein [Caballeronia sp. 15715]|uniref:ornithine cyclodeaminase family protein n=1 Tax=Caballeronia sp. 15715 TaxID=3391030 RepID=UPI0039E233C5
MMSVHTSNADSKASALWLTEQDVIRHVSLADTIEALEAGLVAVSKASAFNIPKALGSFGDGGSMHSLGSALPDAGYCGYKNWVNTKQGAKAVFVLFSTDDGRLLAIMEANALGQLRTSAIAGVGTRWLAPEHANDFAIIGSGKQAMAQIAAVHAVRPLARIRVWSPTEPKRRAFAEQVRMQFEIDVIEAATLDAATDGASIVTLVTRATQPFLSASQLKADAHVNAMGAILPGNAEFHEDLFVRARVVAVDDVVNTQRASREFIDYFDKRSWDGVQSLGNIIAGGVKASPGDGITLFKAMGMGMSDLSVARMVYERALSDERRRHLTLPLSSRAPIRFTS